ncbi:unnamed protein product, partial [Discosporangium mesarthrocarpum]
LTLTGKHFCKYFTLRRYIMENSYKKKTSPRESGSNVSRTDFTLYGPELDRYRYRTGTQFWNQYTPLRNTLPLDGDGLVLVFFQGPPLAGVLSFIGLPLRT